MNLIDTYVSEVGRRLPSKDRTDIEAEIRSALQDMLEERSRSEGRPVDDEMVFAVLKEYGDPEKVAGSYLPERYLIGPALFPTFSMLAKVVLLITGSVVLIGLGVNLGQSAHDLQTGLPIVRRAVTDLYTSVLTSLASLVFIFGIIEWAVRRSGQKVDMKGFPEKQEWDPRSLGKISPPDRVKLGDTIAEIIASFIGILLFNFFPQIFSIGFSSNGGWYIGTGNWTSVPIFSETFFRFVPYLTIVWVLMIILDILLLSQGYWKITTRVYSILLKVINIAIAAAMLAGPSLIALTASGLPAALANLPNIDVAITILHQIVRVVLWLSILGNTIEIIKAFVHIASGKPIAIVVADKKP